MGAVVMARVRAYRVFHKAAQHRLLGLFEAAGAGKLRERGHDTLRARVLPDEALEPLSSASH